MVTAPACSECHGKNQKDDVVIRNILASTRETERHPAVIGGLAGKRDRSLKRMRGDLLEILQSMTPIDVETRGGVHLGQDCAFDFDTPVMNRFVERLVRALLWYEFRPEYFQGNFDWP